MVSINERRVSTRIYTAGEIHSVDCCWLTKINRPPRIVSSIRDCTSSTGVVSSMTTTVIGIMSWKSAVIVTVNAGLISRFV